MIQTETFLEDRAIARSENLAHYPHQRGRAEFPQASIRELSSSEGSAVDASRFQTDVHATLRCRPEHRVQSRTPARTEATTDRDKLFQSGG